MQKKILGILVALLFAVSVSPSWAGPLGLSAVGAYGSVGSSAGALGGGVGLALKWGSFPVVGLQYDLVQTRINVSADYYAIDARGLSGPFSYFVGAGGYFGLGTGGEGGKASFDLGLRIPVGLQFWPVKGIELFLAPVLTVPLFPSPQVGFGAEFGLRVRI